MEKGVGSLASKMAFAYALTGEWGRDVICITPRLLQIKLFLSLPASFLAFVLPVLSILPLWE